MSDDAGTAASAIAASLDALTVRHEAVASLDRALADIVAAAHTVTVAALQRLDTIGAEIEDAVAHQDRLALDTPAGAHEFQRFLLAKHRDIITVVNDAAAQGDTKAAQVRGLLAGYQDSSGPAVNS